MKKFTVVTPNSRPIVFKTEANTFGELKQELSRKHISLTDMSIFEGLTKIDITKMDNDGVLPHDVMYKGQPTNDLVFMITADKKKIKSGMTRQEVIVEIKSKGLCEKVKETFGKNYTNVSTDNLMTILSTCSKKKENSIKPVNVDTNKLKPTAKTETNVNAKEIILDITTALIGVVIKYGIQKEFVDTVLESPSKPEAKDLSYSDRELDEMFKAFK